MQSDQAPCSATRRVEFPSSVTNCLRDEREEFLPLLGSIISDSKLAWLSKGPLLQVVDTSDGSKIAAWTFGAVVRDFKTKVTCVAELPHVMPSGRPGPVDQLAVGLECELTGGMLCVFNLAGSRVIRAINLPSKVTAIDIVSCKDGALGPLHRSLLEMCGIAAVGTNDGQILLIDLQRNDCDKALSTTYPTYGDGVRDELQPSEILLLEDRNLNVSEEYLDKHPAIHLNKKCFMKHQRLVIQFASRNSSHAVMPEDPSITSILYVPQLASLCVGFAFGSFQIWSLKSLSHVYTLPVHEPNPVVRITFQEACDDPNASCYLWTVRGGLGIDNNSGDLDHPVPVYGPPSATMYSLCYDERVLMPDYGFLYKKFMTCSTGFEYDLNGEKDTVGGRLVSLRSLSRGMLSSASTAALSSTEDSTVGYSSNAVSLCLMAWETWGPTGPSSTVNPVNTHMVLFDINQWYFDQMPARLSQHIGSSRNKPVANYMVSFDLGSKISSSGGLLLDVCVNPSSLLQFSSVQNVEEYSRPSSLSFDSVVLMERQVVHLKHPGVQRAFLSNLLSSGPGALMTPTNLFHECLVLGLRPLLMDMSDAVNVPLEDQRTFVLCVALEQHLGRFISRCAREWADGRLSAAGCTLGWLLSVAWNRAAVLKQLAIRLCVQLFDHSGEKLDYNAHRQVHHIVSVFHILETLFETVVQNKWHLSLNEWPQVNLQNDALKLECQYYDVLQWLVDVELLPEGLNPRIPYPAQEIAVFYHSRRLELQQLFDQQGNFEDNTDLLFIDGLLKHQPGGPNVVVEWERDAGVNAGPGAGQYPPASLQALLRTFLVKDVALEVKHSIVIYVLMDLANILDNEQYHSALQNFMQYPAAFQMSVGSMKLTQAFWHLDHKTFDSALDMLLDPLLSVRDIELWQHRCIIRLFTLQGQANMALRYVRARRPPLQETSDIKLHLSLLIANDLIDEAFVYQRNHRTDKNSKLLLLQFFQGCEERNHLRTILQFSLDEEEELAFSQYLESSKHPAADDLRVLYLLKRSRYVEALDVNQDLRRKGRSGGTRDVVVSAFFKTLPSVTRKLAAHCAQQQHKLKSWNQVEKPTPLFVNPKIASPRMQYKSSLMEAALEKSRETWSKLIDRIPPTSSGVESTPFLCTPRTKNFCFSRTNATPVQSNERQNTDRKRPREEDGEDNQHFKRSRFQRLETALAELHNQQQQQREQQTSLQARYSSYSCSDTLPLLHTPIVQRRSPSSRAKLQQQLIARSPGHSAATPQSIIKVRKASVGAESTSPIRHRVSIREEPELTEEESESEVFLKSNESKKGESETDSDPEDKVEEEGPVAIGARRTIDFDSGLSSSDISPNSISSETHVSHSRDSSPSKASVCNISTEKSLSRIVLLSEARKVGKPGLSVTFGKGSVCVYDQDEPVDSEVSVQDESSNETTDLEPSKDDGDVESKAKEQMGDDFEAVGTNNEEQSNIVSEPMPRFRLETSGIGSMTSSDILVDLSLTDNSDVFHSADSSVQEIVSCPSFRNSLARPPVKEIARLSSGSHKTREEADGDTNLSIPSKSAQLVEKSQTLTTSQYTSYSTESKREEGREELQNAELTGYKISSVVHSIITRRSVAIEPVVHDSPSLFAGPSKLKCDSEEHLEKSRSVKDMQSEISPSVESAACDQKSHENTASANSDKSLDSIEIVDIDDESDSDANSERDSWSKHSGEEGQVSDTVEVSENSCDSNSKEFLPENSNIFRTSMLGDASLSSDRDSQSSQSKHVSEDEDHSEDTESREDAKSGHVHNVDAEELAIEHSEHIVPAGEDNTFYSQIKAEYSKNRDTNEDSSNLVDSVPQYSEKIAVLEPATSPNNFNFNTEVNCAEDSSSHGLDKDPSIYEEMDADVDETNADPPASKYNFNEGCVIDTVEISAEDSEPQGSHELHNDENVIEVHTEESDPTLEISDHVISDNVAHNSEDIVNFQAVQSEEDRREEAGIMPETDDMPSLRLDTAAVDDSPSKTEPEIKNVVSVESENQHDNTLTAKCAEGGSVVMEDESIFLSKPPKDSCLSSPKTALEESSSSPAKENSRRKEAKRRVSISSSKSETVDDDMPSRRVTRAMKSSLEPSSSSDGTAESRKHTRQRSYSTSSVGSKMEEHTEVHEVKKNTRSQSVLSQGSVADIDQAKLPHDKLEKIAEVNSESEKVLGSGQKRKRSSGSTSGNSPSRRFKGRGRRDQSSMDSSNVDYASSSRSVEPPKNVNEEEESDDDQMSVSSVRSSQRLRSKYLPKYTPASPSTTVMLTENPEEQLKAASSQSPNTSTIDAYETSRRLTRHQRALLAKSKEISTMHHASISRPVQPLKIEEHEETSDDDRTSVSSVRSSRRLRMKRQQEAFQGSPSSTASTIINPALTPSSQRRLRQSSSDDVNRDASPVSSIRRQRTKQPGTPTHQPSTPTRRSARLNILHSAQSEDGDAQSVASMSPSSVTSGRKRSRRRLSVSSEAPSEQYAFSSPQVQHSNINEHPDGDATMTDAFAFSTPDSVATPRKGKCSSTESNQSSGTSKKSARQGRSLTLQTIKEESSTSKISQDDSLLNSPVAKFSGRPSWFFMEPRGGEGHEEVEETEEILPSKQQGTTAEGNQGWHSAYQRRSKFSLVPVPKTPYSDSEDSNGSEDSRPQRKTRQSASSQKQKK